MSKAENHRSIAQIARTLRSVIESETLEHYFWVGGRIDRLYKSDLGHVYFELVDGDNRIKCVLWEERVGRIRFDLKNHLDVEIYGDVNFFERRAEAQINVLKIRLTDDTVHAANAIEELRAEGLFPPVRKDPPAKIRRIGILTGRSSRAIGDFETTYQEAGTRAVLAPISWQYAMLEGERAAQSIVDALTVLDGRNEVDIIVIIRGGGRNENLAAFDELEVLRAIVGCSKYVVTGIGHHRDHVLADDVADYVVATPTAAAIYMANLCLNSESPGKSAWTREANRVSVPAEIEGSEIRTAHETPAPQRQRRYDLILFVLFAAAICAVALLVYTMLNNF